MLLHLIFYYIWIFLTIFMLLLLKIYVVIFSVMIKFIGYLQFLQNRRKKCKKIIIHKSIKIYKLN